MLGVSIRGGTSTLSLPAVGSMPASSRFPAGPDTAKKGPAILPPMLSLFLRVPTMLAKVPRLSGAEFVGFGPKLVPEVRYRISYPPKDGTNRIVRLWAGNSIDNAIRLWRDDSLEEARTLFGCRPPFILLAPARPLGRGTGPAQHQHGAANESRH